MDALAEDGSEAGLPLLAEPRLPTVRSGDGEDDGRWTMDDVDEQLMLAGGFGAFQWLVLLFCSLLLGLDAAITMLPVFTGRAISREAAMMRGCGPIEGKSSLPAFSFVQSFALTADCGAQWQAAGLQSLFFVGFGGGAMVAGQLSDLWGRSLTMLLTTIWGLVAAVCCACAPSVYLYVPAVTALGFGVGSKVTVGYLLANESVPSAWRSLTVGILWTIWGLLAAGLAPTAWAVDRLYGSGDGPRFAPWRFLILVTAAPQLPFLLAWMLSQVPESPQFVATIMRDRPATAKLFACISAFNARWSWGTVAPVGPATPGADAEMVPPQDVRPAVAAIRSDLSGSSWLFLQPMGTLHLDRSVHVTIGVLLFASFASSSAFFGLALAAGSLSSNLYTAFAAAMLCQCPGYVAIAPLTDHIGRRATLAGALFLCGTSLCVLAVVAPAAASRTFTLPLALISQLGATIAFSTVFISAFEAVPPRARAACISLCSLSARFGGIASPYINLGGHGNAIFGACTLAAGGFACLLPETLSIPARG